MQAGTAFAHFLSGRYEEALLWADKAFRDLPTYITAVSVTAASNALAGRLEEARQAMRLWRQIDTGLRMSNLTDWFPIRRPEDFAKWSDGLRRAGLPE
ncbi:MAG TPA: hypothetical protein VLD36_03860 [Burkholderiales bacterium]|nr:hypothetical protein [Burkholderiales bacterium]